MSITASTLQSVDSLQQIQNHANPCEVDSQVAAQALNNMYSMHRNGIEHDFSAGYFRRLQQTEVDKPSQDVGMHPQARRGILQRRQVASRAHNSDLVR